MRKLTLMDGTIVRENSAIPTSNQGASNTVKKVHQRHPIVSLFPASAQLKKMGRFPSGAMSAPTHALLTIPFLDGSELLLN